MMCLGGSTAPNPFKGFGEARLQPWVLPWLAMPGSVTSPCSVGVVGSWLAFFENVVTSSGSGREGEAALAEPSRSWSWGILHPLLPVLRQDSDTGRSQGSTCLCNPMVCSDDAEKFLLAFC